MLVPVILFVYNRPWHTRQTIDSLKKNELADSTELIVFSDAPKNEKAESQVKEVRDYLKTIEGFKSVKIIEREHNWGLAASIIDGVTEVVNEYGKVIVLEDDIVTSPVFLQYMNQALDFYADKKDIWHISGWSYPIESEGLGDAFLWRGMNCWGWATWSDRWKHFKKDPEGLIKNWTSDDKKAFDLGGTGVFWSQVLGNAAGKLNTWAIFWYATIFQNKGLCLNPTVSYVENIGHDGSGVHCGNDTSHISTELCKKGSINLPVELSESKSAVSRIIKFYKSNTLPLYKRALNKIGRKLFGRNLIQ
ncbi:glycosyltransferase [Pseudomonas sp. CW003PS]|nr:glycosyltransferase [Pseudomonas sp. CW003PS]